MGKFYCVMLDDVLHWELRKASFDQGKKMSVLVREGIEIVLEKNKEFSEGKQAAQTRGGCK